MSKLRWRGLVRAAAVVDLLIFAATAVALTDIEAALFAAGLAVGLLLLRWGRGRLGLVGLGLLFLDTAAWMLPGALSNLRHGEGFGGTAVPATLAVVSVAGLIGVVAALIGRGDGAARLVATGAVALVVVALGVAAFSSADESEAGPGELAVEARDVRFSDTTLEAEAGRIDVEVSNRDLFWHTFTISELDVNLRLPSVAERRATFDAEPGTYEFVCAIPGHTQAGMKGRLVVR